MEAIYLTGKGTDKMEFGKIKVPTPGSGQVLIKVEACPINPSDLYCMEGKYGEFMNFEYPFVSGWEGSGTVVASGGGMHSWYMQGKRVAFSKCNEDTNNGEKIKLGGTMAQYAVTNAYQCVPIDNDVSFNIAASFFVNPITALGLLEQVTKDKGTSVVLTAAASQLSKMMIRLFNDNNITVIATVRKAEQVEDLKKNYNVQHIINISDEDYLESFKKAVTDLNCKHILECIGGEVFGKLVSEMPNKTQVILYGNLSRAKVCEFEPFALFTKDIQIRGFLLNVWLESKNLLKIVNIIRKVKKMIRQNLSTEINKEFDLKDFKEAIEFYEKDMSRGKIILKPWGIEN